MSDEVLLPAVPSLSPSSAEPASPRPPVPEPVRIGIIGSGFVAQWFMEAAEVVEQAQVVAVTSAHPERAAAFAARHGIGASYASVPEMLEAGVPQGPTPLDLVYVGSPNALHAQHTVAALEAGFAVLVEKPFATTVAQAEAMVAAARHAGGLLVEGWMTAFAPGTAVLRQALKRLGAGAHGPHRAVLVKEQYSSRLDRYRAGELPPAFDPAMGGGSLMDLGTYPISLAIHLFGEPSHVTATGRLLDSGVDSHGTVVLGYDTLAGVPTNLEVVCLHSKTSMTTAGSLVAWDHEVLSLDDAQIPRTITLRTPQGQEDLSVPSSPSGGPALGDELAAVCTLVAQGAHESEVHPLRASLACVRVLEQARNQLGVRFPGDSGATMRS